MARWRPEDQFILHHRRPERGASNRIYWYVIIDTGDADCTGHNTGETGDAG